MALNELDVFVNCPFDDNYRPMFNAMVYTVIRSGYVMRCALEDDDSGEQRILKICKIIGECQFAIHDISCTEVDGDPPLPRFNMPLELGIYFGAVQYGGRAQKRKSCIIFDREKYRFQRFISDIGGYDIHSHSGNVEKMIKELATWLRGKPGGIVAGGGQALFGEYQHFWRDIIPAWCRVKNIEVSELSFPDYCGIVQEYVATLNLTPSESALTASPIAAPVPP